MLDRSDDLKKLIERNGISLELDESMRVPEAADEAKLAKNQGDLELIAEYLDYTREV